MAKWKNILSIGILLILSITIVISIVAILSITVGAAADAGRCRTADMPVVDNGYVDVGNSNYSDIGATLLVTCDPGYKSHDSIVRCEKDVRWSNVLGGDCYKEYRAIGYGTWNSLHEAARRGDVDEVTRLHHNAYSLDAKSDSGSYGRSAIHLASNHGHLNVVKYLISADPTLEFDRDIAAGALPLHVAALGGQLEIVKYFIDELGTDIESVDDKFGRTPLHMASGTGYLPMVKWLVDKGANYTAVTNSYDYRSTPIHLAATFGHLEVAKYFIEHVDSTMVNWKNAQGSIAMHKAALGGHVPVVSYFIVDKNVDIEERSDMYGRTALHMACQGDHLELVKWLVNRGANVTATSNDYDSNIMPIQWAAQFGHLPIVRYFVENFPNIQNETDSWGRTCLDYAQACPAPGCYQVAKYLTSVQHLPSTTERMDGTGTDIQPINVVLLSTVLLPTIILR